MTYPHSEAWGDEGRTLTDKDAAFAKLRDLAAQNKVPAPTLRRNPQTHELSYREICEIMGRNLRVIVTAEPEPEQEQLELFDAAQGGRQ